MEWRQYFIRTFLERDLPALGVNTAADTMRRFWSIEPFPARTCQGPAAYGRQLAAIPITF